jgi:hypothetical protein
MVVLSIEQMFIDNELPPTETKRFRASRDQNYLTLIRELNRCGASSQYIYGKHAVLWVTTVGEQGWISLDILPIADRKWRDRPPVGDYDR